MSQPTDQMSPEPYRVFEATYVDALDQMRATGFKPITLEDALVQRIEAAQSGDPELERAWWDREIGTGSSIFYFPRTEDSLDQMVISIGTAPVERSPRYPETAVTEAISPDWKTLATLSGHSVRLTDFVERQNDTDPTYNHIWQLLVSPDVLQDYMGEAIRRKDPEADLMTVNTWPYGNHLADSELWSETVMWPLILASGARGSHLGGAGARIVRGRTTVPIVGRRIDASNNADTEQ